MVKPGVMPAAQPPHLQRLVVLIVMGIDRFDPTDLTRLFFQLAGLHGSLHSEVSIIFAWIGATPISLTRIRFQHRFNAPL